MKKEEKKNKTSSSSKIPLLHIKVIDGEMDTVYEIGKAFQEFKKKAGFEFEAIITNDKIEFRDIDYLLKELIALYKKKKGLGEKDGKN